MKLRYVLRALTSPPLPPIMQPAIGNKADNAWLGEPPSGGFLGLFGFGSASGPVNKVYTASAADMRRLRPEILPDLRAQKNREIAARRRSMRGEDTPLPVSFTAGAPPSSDPLPYSLDAFPMSDEARAFYGGGSTKPEWGPRHQDRR